MTCQLELATFLMKPRVGGIEPGEHRSLVTMGVAHERSGLDRADGAGELLVGQEAGHVAVVPAAVTRDGARRGWEHASGLQFADLLD